MAARLGIIGGMGPMATAYFMELLVSMTNASRDQDHPEIIVHSMPSIPDRTEYILGNSGEDPCPEIIRIGKSLEEQGATVIAIPCMSACCFHSRLQKEIEIPIINPIVKCAKLLKKSKIKSAGILATAGTMKTGIFQQELTKLNIRPLIPSPESQKLVTRLIYDNVKANRQPDTRTLVRIANELKLKGAECVVLGCTELSVIKKHLEEKSGFVDTLEILAAESIVSCGCEVTPAMKNPVTRFR